MGRVALAAIVVGLLASGCSGWHAAPDPPRQTAGLDAERHRTVTYERRILVSCIDRAHGSVAFRRGAIGVVTSAAVSLGDDLAVVDFFTSNEQAESRTAQVRTDPDIDPQFVSRVANAVVLWRSAPADDVQMTLMNCLGDATS